MCHTNVWITLANSRHVLKFCPEAAHRRAVFTLCLNGFHGAERDAAQPLIFCLESGLGTPFLSSPNTIAMAPPAAGSRASEVARSSSREVHALAVRRTLGFDGVAAGCAGPHDGASPHDRPPSTGERARDTRAGHPAQRRCGARRGSTRAGCRSPARIRAPRWRTTVGLWLRSLRR